MLVLLSKWEGHDKDLKSVIINTDQFVYAQPFLVSVGLEYAQVVMSTDTRFVVPMDVLSLYKKLGADV